MGVGALELCTGSLGRARLDGHREDRLDQVRQTSTVGHGTELQQAVRLLWYLICATLMQMEAHLRVVLRTKGHGESLQWRRRVATNTEQRRDR